VDGRDDGEHSARARGSGGAVVTTKVFVISDLHLGGGEGFQMCSAAGRERLVDFLGWVRGQRSSTVDVRLVIAGDTVDFLAEREADGSFLPFSRSEANALGKLNRILFDTKAVWDALAALRRDGTPITILLGNHDVELSLPALRARLAERLGGPVDFLVDNEAFTVGTLLIEHGNRYDAFNAVDHDGLRRLRSQLSRKETPREDLRVQPGSRLVSDVMNEIKARYPFIDLLKPETAGVLALAGALGGATWARAGKLVKIAAEAWARSGADEEGVPRRRELIAAEAPQPKVAAAPVELPDRDAFELADELAAAAGAGDGRIGSFEEFKLAPLLLRAFRMRRKKDATTWAVDVESTTYLRPARAMAQRGFRVVVMGHTHFAKRISLDGDGVYLNTGTWADLMCLPDQIYDASDEAALEALRTFLANLKASRIDAYRRPVPTFACVEIGPDGAKGDLFFYDGDGATEPVTTPGLLKRLGLAPA
jgi:UDP-2,3-diacylglucosamine pyrophosphatase LpxH